MNRAFSAVFHFRREFSRVILWTDCEFSGRHGWNFESRPGSAQRIPQAGPTIYTAVSMSVRVSGAISPEISTFPQRLLLLLVLYVFYLI